MEEPILAVTGAIFNILGIIALLIGGLWAYTKYVVERGLLPPVQFDVDCKKLGNLGDNSIYTFEVNLKNVGSSTLVARWLFLDIRYIKKNDQELALFNDHRAGRLRFSHSLLKDLNLDTRKLVDNACRSASERHKKTLSAPARSRGFPVLPYDTFVQPSVNQMYTFATILPDDTACVLMHASFQYGQKLNPVQGVIYRLSRKLGLIHYSLQHVSVPHSVERVFWVAN
jgi:hypothetical protein